MTANQFSAARAERCYTNARVREKTPSRERKIDLRGSRRVNLRGLSRPRRSAPAGSVADLKIVSDPIDAAEQAGLRYVSDDQPGYTRRVKGDDFDYFDTEGKLMRDEQRLLRVKRLAIPPAYTSVWICPSPNTSAGARCGRKTNTIVWSLSVMGFRKSAGA
jgi:hypothetical protein